VLEPLERSVSATWANLTVVPFMNTSATDGVFTRAAGIPTYGVAGIAIERDDVRAHGRDERVGVDSFYKGNEFFYRYLRAVTSAR
jgi:acetylornithine deacetylase/succinyl-diaminopimelate desuccinylase-like protein